jgi:hypothetical protein
VNETQAACILPGYSQCGLLLGLQRALCGIFINGSQSDRWLFGALMLTMSNIFI